MKYMQTEKRRMGTWMDNERKRNFTDGSSKPSVVTKDVPLGTSFDFYLTSDIEDASNYDEWVQICAEASPCDLIEVHINCFGGRLDTAIQIHDMLIETKADVFISIEGACCSGASLIAMAGMRVKVLPNSYMMIHSWTGGAYGKFGNVIENTEFQKKWFSNVMTRSYNEFLTNTEIKNVLDGKDLYLDAQEVENRFILRDEKRKEKLESREKQIEELKIKINKILEPKGFSLEDMF